MFESLLVRMSRYAFATGFADDGCILVNGVNAAACQPRLQQALKVAEEWARENGLQFAPEKNNHGALSQEAKKREAAAHLSQSYILQRYQLSLPLAISDSRSTLG